MTASMQMLPRNLPAPTSAALVIARLLTTAASQIGYREGQSGADWNNDNAFGKWYGTNGVSWCAQFVSWAAFAAGIPATVIPKHQYTPSGWNWFTAHDCDVTTPKAGDIFYVYGYVASEKVSRVHHVGIVEKVLAGGKIQTIEGNTNTTGSAQGNGVYRLVRPISATKLRFARPPYQLAVVAPVKPTTPTDVTPPKPPKGAEMQLTDLVTYNKVLYGPKGTEGVWNAALHRKLDLLITSIANLKLAVAKVDADDAEDDAQHAAVMAELAEINQMLADAPEPEPVPKA